jgi:phage-related protein
VALKHEIFIYTDARGRAPLREYMKNLKAQKDDDSRIRLMKIQDYINLLQEKGTMLPKTICKHFTDKKHSWLWELRPGGDRVLFFAWDGGSFVLLHAFRKQSQKTPESELRKAEREYKDWIERNGKK